MHLTIKIYAYKYRYIMHYRYFTTEYVDFSDNSNIGQLIYKVIHIYRWIQIFYNTNTGQYR